MNKLIFSAMLGATALLAPLSLPAATVAANGTEAKKLVKDDGYIIFAYADGWDEYSKKRCERLMADKLIRKAARQAVLMPFPIPEKPDEARQKKQGELRGELNIPGSHSYPALIFIDKDGWHYATLIGREVARGSSKELAALITDRMEKGRQRRRMDAEASSTTDRTKRSRLRFDAHHIDGLTGMDKWTRQDIRDGDPKDTTGVIRATDFNAHGFANNIGKDGIKAGMERVDKMLADPAYTPRQKQQMCAAALGMLRRDGSITEAAAMRRYATLMQQLVPESPEGRAAARILATWIPGLHYGRGWNPSSIPTKEMPVDLQGELPISEPGTYTLRFDYTHGRMALVVHGVALYDGTTKVAEDMHRGLAGYHPTQNSYTLTVPRRLKEPRIRVTLGQGDRDSHGRIVIEKK